jgi:proteic killer suppression protein
MRAAPSLDSFRTLPGRRHELVGDRAGQLLLDLVHPDRLVFEPADEPVPKRPDGGLDWSQVRSIRILAVEDTHD